MQGGVGHRRNVTTLKSPKAIHPKLQIHSSRILMIFSKHKRMSPFLRLWLAKWRLHSCSSLGTSKESLRGSDGQWRRGSEREEIVGPCQSNCRVRRKGGNARMHFAWVSHALHSASGCKAPGPRLVCRRCLSPLLLFLLGEIWGHLYTTCRHCHGAPRLIPPPRPTPTSPSRLSRGLPRRKKGFD